MPRVHCNTKRANDGQGSSFSEALWPLSTSTEATRPQRASNGPQVTALRPQPGCTRGLMRRAPWSMPTTPSTSIPPRWWPVEEVPSRASMTAPGASSCSKGAMNGMGDAALALVSFTSRSLDILTNVAQRAPPSQMTFNPSRPSSGSG
ncbi:MAG: hypothetical protein R2749_18305 [Acidimicrobiales bacterium]